MDINKKEKIEYIVKQEQLYSNKWKWVYEADDKTINDLYDYWTQEIKHTEGC